VKRRIQYFCGEVLLWSDKIVRICALFLIKAYQLVLSLLKICLFGAFCRILGAGRLKSASASSKIFQSNAIDDLAISKVLSVL
jgi:nucleoside permease NupC